MYKVYLDGEILYHSNMADEFPLAEAKLTLEVNKAGTFVFSIYDNNPRYSSIKKMKSIVEIYDDADRLFRGRVLNAKRGMYKDLQVTCEGELAFLVDSKQRPYQFEGSIEEYFGFLIANHNVQVDETRQFKVGYVTVSNPEATINCSDTEYTSTLDSLQENLIEKFGGYMWIREEEDGVYMDYLSNFETINLQEIRFGENLVDFEEVIKGQEIATAIIPLGCKLKNEEENESEGRLTIKEVNAGVDYIYSPTAVEKYGWIYKVITWDDETLPENLLKKAGEELQNYINLTQSIELSAIDLHNVDSSIRAFHYGSYVRIISEPHNLNEKLLIRKMEINLLDVADGLLQLGAERKTFVDQQIDSKKTLGNIVQRVKNVEAGQELNKEKIDSLAGQRIVWSDTEPEDTNNLWLDTSVSPNLIKKWNGETWTVINDTADIVNEVYQNVYSAIEQASSNIMMEIGEKYYLKEDESILLSSVSSEYQQLADRFEFTFKQLEQSLTDVINGNDAKFQDVAKYIRFIDGSIELGQVGNPFMCKICNNRISFLQNNVEVAYVADRKIYVTEGNFINMLNIGSFEFGVRKNGNLSVQ